jgi:hypothetical protein
MADLIPKIKVTDPPATGRRSFQKQENGSSTTVDGTSHIHPLPSQDAPDADPWLPRTIQARCEASKPQLTFRTIGNRYTECIHERWIEALGGAYRPALASMSTCGSYDMRGQRLTPHCVQQILQRTNTSPAIQKLRPQPTEPVSSQSPNSPNEANADKKQSSETPRDASGSKADKK